MTKYEGDNQSVASPIGVGRINRFPFFEALKQFVDMKDVTEAHINPRTLTLYRLRRDSEGHFIHHGDTPERTVETYWLSWDSTL